MLHKIKYYMSKFSFLDLSENRYVQLCKWFSNFLYLGHIILLVGKDEVIWHEILIHEGKYPCQYKTHIVAYIYAVKSHGLFIKRRFVKEACVCNEEQFQNLFILYNQGGFFLNKIYIFLEMLSNLSMFKSPVRQPGRGNLVTAGNFLLIKKKTIL